MPQCGEPRTGLRRWGIREFGGCRYEGWVLGVGLRTTRAGSSDMALQGTVEVPAVGGRRWRCGRVRTTHPDKFGIEGSLAIMDLLVLNASGSEEYSARLMTRSMAGPLSDRWIRRTRPSRNLRRPSEGPPRASGDAETAVLRVRPADRLLAGASGSANHAVGCGTETLVLGLKSRQPGPAPTTKVH